MGLLHRNATSPLSKKKLIDAEKERLERTVVPVTEEVKRILAEMQTAPIPQQGSSLAGLLRRPEMTYEKILNFHWNIPPLPEEVREQVEIQVKYEGYISKSRKPRWSASGGWKKRKFRMIWITTRSGLIGRSKGKTGII